MFKGVDCVYHSRLKQTVRKFLSIMNAFNRDISFAILTSKLGFVVFKIHPIKNVRKLNSRAKESIQYSFLTMALSTTLIRRKSTG